MIPANSLFRSPATLRRERSRAACHSVDSCAKRTVRQGVITRKVLRGARWPGEVALEGGVITEVGSVAARAGDEVIDCEGGIVTAGFVNTHHHLYQWLTRGRATSCDLFTWLQELYPVWARISVDDVEAAATVGLAELAMSGATTVADHHYLVPRGDDSVFDAIAVASASRWGPPALVAWIDGPRPKRRRTAARRRC